MRRSWCLLIIAASIAAPAAGQVHLGVQTGPEPPASGGPARGGSSPGFVNFDDFPSSVAFIDLVAVTDEFAAFGVTFSGPGGNDGGAVVDEGGGFGVTGHSSPNFLAFNTLAVLSDGGVPRGPETMLFDPPASEVTIHCGLGFGATGSVDLECFDPGAVSLGSDSIAIASALQPLTVVAPDIASCVLSFTSSNNALACDDLVFAPVPVGLMSFEVE